MKLPDTFLFFIPILLIIIIMSVLSWAQYEPMESLKGRILLDVEAHGEAWYVHPLTEERYYLGNPMDAFMLMRFFGLGISNADLANIPEAGSNEVGDMDLRRRVAGRILLQVESRGEGWYVHRDDLKRYRLTSPEEAFDLMRQLGLGVPHDTLWSIPDGGAVSHSVYHSVPFAAQAPYGEWHDLRQQEGCEEATVIMALAWANGEELPLDEAKEKILAMSDWEKQHFGYFVDTSARDTADRLLQVYSGYYYMGLEYDIRAADIRHQLDEGRVVIVPVNGKMLNNGYFVNGGSERHMILIIGFDWSRGEFIVHDPGTRAGENYRYAYTLIDDALRDYASGTYVPIPEKGRTAMIVVHPRINPPTL